MALHYSRDGYSFSADAASLYVDAVGFSYDSFLCITC